MVDNAFTIDEQPIAIPEAARDVDLGSEIERLHVRAGALQDEVERERSQNKSAKRRLLLGLLDVADALDRVLAQPLASIDASPAYEKQRGNVEACRRLLASRLQAASVTPMLLIGEVVDPALADVEDTVTKPELPEETVVKEILSGYFLEGQVLRRARVVVSTHE
jgi:molecular chaperone GrpE